MTTNERGLFPSDNYIDEYLINEKLLGFVYFRRDEYNLCDVFMVDLEIKIPDKYTNLLEEEVYSELIHLSEHLICGEPEVFFFIFNRDK